MAESQESINSDEKTDEKQEEKEPSTPVRI
jgi:hypothetical protein